MIPAERYQLPRGGENVLLLLRAARNRQLVFPFAFSYQTGSDSEVLEAGIRRQMHKWLTVKENGLSWQVPLLAMVKRCNDRLSEVDLHPSPSAEVGHYLEESPHAPG